MTAVAWAALNPFPGLRAFAPEDADLFFGREQQIDTLRQRVLARPFVAVAGASGCGKSSLVLAGLLRALERHAAATGEAAWRPVILRPGRQPIGHLAAALAPSVGADASPEAVGALYGRLRLSEAGLLEAARSAPGLLVVVDQFEEIFRYERMSDPEEAAAFVKLLLHAARDLASPVRVVITLRSDALGHCADFAGLAEAVSDGQFLVPKLTRDQRRQAIVGPIQRRGAGIKHSLVQRILNDVTDGFDDLPVMQHALTRTWAHWAATAGEPARDIEVGDYVAIGTSVHALEEHAKGLLAETVPEAERLLTARVLRALTDRRPDGAEVRRPLPYAELCEVVGADCAVIVDRLRSPAYCFLRPAPPEPLDGNPVIDITHESLIRQWPALREWIAAEATSRAELQRLLDDTQRWQAGQLDLRQGLDLGTTLAWREREQPNPAWVRLCVGAEAAATWPHALLFLDKSRRAERRSHRRALAARWGAGAVALVVMGLLVLWGLSQRSEGLAQAQRLGQELATGAFQQLRLDPALAAHLAVAALEHAPDNPQAEQALRQAVETLGVAHVQQIYEFGEAAHDAQLDRARQRIAVVGRGHVAIVDAATLEEVQPRRELPWPASRVWLAGDPARLILQSDTQQGLQVQSTDGQVLGAWNCEGGPEGDHVWSMQLSADERWLAAGCHQGRIALWDLKSAQAIEKPTILRPRFDATVTALAFHADEPLLVSGDADGMATVWDLRDTRRPMIGPVGNSKPDTLIRHDKPIRALAVWAGETRHFVATGADDATAVVWAIDLPRRRLAVGGKGDQVRWTLPHQRPVTGVRIDAQNGLLTVSGNRLQFWNGETPTTSRARHNAWILDSSVAPDGSLVVSSSDDGLAMVWSRVGDAVATLRGHAGAVRRASFLDNRRILTASDDGTLRVWRVDPVQVLHAAPDHWMMSVAVSPDGGRLAYCGEYRLRDGGFCGLVPLRDPGSFPDRDAQLELPAGVSGDHVLMSGLHWNEAGTELFGRYRSYDAIQYSGPLRWQFGKADAVRPEGASIVFHRPEGRGELLLIDPDGGVRVAADLPGPEPGPALFTLPSGAPPMTAVLSHDGRRIAVADESAILVYDRGAPAVEPRVLAGHAGTVMSLAFSPDDGRLASASLDGTARVWPLAETDAPVVSMVGGHTAAIFVVRFNARGDQIVTGGGDGTLRVWDAGSGRGLVSLPWHTAAVNDVRFAPGEPVLFSASDDGTVASGRCRTCDLDLPTLVRQVFEGGLARLSRSDAEFVARVRSEGMNTPR